MIPTYSAQSNLNPSTTRSQRARPRVYALPRLNATSAIASVLCLCIDVAGAVVHAGTPLLSTILIVAATALALLCALYDDDASSGLTAPTVIALVASGTTTIVTLLIPALHGLV